MSFLREIPCSWLACALAVGIACSSAPPPTDVVPAEDPTRSASVAEQPDLVLFLVTGLRADVPGQPGAESAFTQALGLGPSVRFTAAYAQSSSPFMSMGSLLTGLYPAAIPMCGIDYSSIAADGGGSGAWCSKLPPERYTLAEVLGLYGYQTALVTKNLASATRFEGEFHHAAILDRWTEDPGEGWRALRDAVSGWWVAHADSPRLLVVVRSEKDWMGALAPPPGMGPEKRTEVSPEQQHAAELRYEQVAAELGSGVKGVLDVLGDSGARPRWTALTSLHGLSLLEPQGFNDEPVETWDHNVLLDRTLRVPLLLAGPATPSGGREVTQVVELADLFPTFAGLAGALPPSDLHGEDLLAVDGAGDDKAWAYAELGDMLAVRRGDHVLLFRTFLHDRPSLDPELDKMLMEAIPGKVPYFTMHDVLRDPGQHQDLCRTQHDELDRLRILMGAIRRGPGAVPPGVLDAEKVWDLRMSRTQSYW